MCVGGRAPKQKQSAEEIRAAKSAVDKWNERQEDGYVDLEHQAIADSRVDHTGRLQGIGAANLAQQEAMAYNAASAGRKGLDFGAVGTAMATSAGKTNALAEKQGLQIRDAKTMGVIRTGQDMANNSANTVMAAARNGFSSSSADLQAQMTRLQARNQAIGQVASTAMAAGAYKMAQPKRLGWQPGDKVDGGMIDKNGLFVDLGG